MGTVAQIRSLLIGVLRRWRLRSRKKSRLSCSCPKFEGAQAATCVQIIAVGRDIIKKRLAGCSRTPAGLYRNSSGEFFRFEIRQEKYEEWRMHKDIRTLVEEHHAFYEVSPYYVVFEEKHGSPAARTRTIQAGFDVEIFGVNPKRGMVSPASDPDYGEGIADLQEIANGISRHINGSCSLEVIASPSRMVLGGQGHAEVEGMLRIRIWHSRGLDQPAGPPEEQALQELEKKLHGFGLARGSRAA